MATSLFADYLTFLRVLGWAMATIVCGLAAGAPRHPPRRAGLAFSLFCAAQLSFGIGGFFHYDALSFDSAMSGWLALAKLASFGFLREFARVTCGDRGGRMASQRMHLPLAAAIVLAAVGMMFPGRGGWVARLGEPGLLLLPPLICADAIWQLLRWARSKGELPWKAPIRHRAVLAVATAYVSGCVLLALPEETFSLVDVLQPLVPWLLTGSVAWANLRAIGARGRLAGGFALTLAVAVVAVPVAMRSLAAGDARTRLLAGGLVVVFCAAAFVFAWWQALALAQQLAVARREAASRAKTEFLAFLGHELRTPLQAILGRIELLGEKDDPGARAAAAATIAAEGRLMLTLVNDLLDLGAIEAARFELRSQAFSLRTLLATTAVDHGSIARAKGLEFELVVAPHVPDGIVGDETRWRQILGNLLGNAVKYTQGGGVELRVTREPRRKGDGADATRVRLTVRDTGIGLPPEKIPQLFTLFTRLDSGRAGAREGAGVGLALVHRLVDLMGGSVMAANRADGLGAEFTVELPTRAATVAASPLVAATSGRGAAQRVLVVEDHGAAREVLMDFLRSLGHTPVAAADGVAMWIAIAAGKFDAVVLDVNLPDADGLKLAGELVRRRGPGAGPRLIGCSADARPETRVAALAAGMDAFCVKPVNRATLAAALGGLSGGRDLFTLIRTDDVAGAARLRTRAELPAECGAIQCAADACDWDEVRRRAHHLRNSALILGESALAAAARSVEEAAARADAPATRRTLEEIHGLGAGNQASSPALQNARG